MRRRAEAELVARATNAAHAARLLAEGRSAGWLSEHDYRTLSRAVTEEIDAITMRLAQR